MIGIALYYYDGSGTMVKSVIGEVITYYGSPAYQLKSDGTNENTRKYYAFGNTTLAMRENDIVVWLMSDQINSTTVTANADGMLASEIKYTAFGEVRTVNGVTVTDNRYTGQREEVEIGLYYYVARYYDPVLAHFIQADTVVPEAGNALGWDRYTYTQDNPLRYTDPSGHFWWVVAGFVAGAAISYGVQVYNNYQNDSSNPWGNVNLVEVVGGGLMGAGTVLCAPAAVGMAGDALVGTGLITGSTALFSTGTSLYQTATIMEANIAFGSPGKSLPKFEYNQKGGISPQLAAKE